MAKARMCPPQNLKVHPAQADRFQLGSNVVFQQRRPPERLAGLTRKHEHVCILIYRLLHRIAKEAPRFYGPNRSLEPRTFLGTRAAGFRSPKHPVEHVPSEWPEAHLGAFRRK